MVKNWRTTPNWSILRGACSFGLLCLELIILLVYACLVFECSSDGWLFLFIHFCNALMPDWLNLSYFVLSCHCACTCLSNWLGLFNEFERALRSLWIFLAACWGGCVDASIRNSMFVCWCLNRIAHGGSYNRRYNCSLTATILRDVCATRRYRIGTSSTHECRVSHRIEILGLKGAHASLKLICPRCLARWRTKRLRASKAHILW